MLDNLIDNLYPRGTSLTAGICFLISALQQLLCSRVKIFIAQESLVLTGLTIVKFGTLLALLI